ncbi:forkhead box protein M1 isoform X1 [Sphaeramia orbicularis]|uniref:forkhead box protein M1 isoform X1 n=1 Tax=Sphaeramia orbicularis TaxID=375764 RepID=UPI00117EE72B|nr:forkhead box protein M1 isoform X1 [Sphaeramia orbicularis]
MTMRRSPRRPLILKRRKLPFQQNDQPPTDSHSQSGPSTSKDPPKSAANQCLPDGVRFMGHPSMPATQVVVIPKTVDLQSVIGVLTAKGKERGAHGPNTFILLSESSSCSSGSSCQPVTEVADISMRSTAGQPSQDETLNNSLDVKPVIAMKSLKKEVAEGPLDDSLSNIQWLGKITTSPLEPDLPTPMVNKENQNSNSQVLQADKTQSDTEGVLKQPISERPPYSYMAMIQFAINSRRNRRMTLKEIYTWIEDHFPYFRDVAKKGWKNSIRHNLSLHDMFIRETSPDGKVSFWTIRPEANRFLTLDQVYKPDCGPTTAPGPVSMLLFPDQQPKSMLPDSKKTPTGTERRMKPLLPRTDSYLVPIQLPVASSVLMPPSSSSQFTPSCSQQKRNIPRGTKRVRIAPKVTQVDAPSAVIKQHKEIKIEVKEEPIPAPIKCETPKALSKRAASSSRRKQHLVHSVHEEPLLLCPNNTFFDSGVASDASAFHDMHDSELDRHEQPSPDREFSFKTPIKSSSHLTSSTPSKPPSNILPELWKVTPVGKGSQSVLDFSPIRTPSGPTVTPRRDYTTLSFSSTPFKDLPLFNSPRELLTSAPSTVAGPAHAPMECLHGGCSIHLPHAGGSTPMNRSLTEGLVLDTMNDSLSKIFLDISFSGLDDEDFGMANISWSEFIPQLK